MHGSSSVSGHFHWLLYCEQWLVFDKAARNPCPWSPHFERWECSLKGRETWLLALLVDIIFHRRLLLFQLIFQAEITFTSATETLPMHHLGRADARVADATNRWHNNKHKYRHPIDHQMRKARNKFNYINPFFYLRNIKNNLKSVVTGRRWTQTTNGHNTRV